MRKLTWSWSALESLSECLAEELDPNWNIKVNHPHPVPSVVTIYIVATFWQVTILEPGPFRTKCPTDSMIMDPVHPAYTDPSLPTMQFRSVFANPNPVFNGDPEKFAEVVHRIAYLEHPPLRLPVHTGSLVAIRMKGKQLLETADKWESWSEDVLVEE